MAPPLKMTRVTSGCSCVLGPHSLLSRTAGGRGSQQDGASHERRGISRQNSSKSMEPLSSLSAWLGVGLGLGLGLGSAWLGLGLGLGVGLESSLSTSYTSALISASEGVYLVRVRARVVG